MSRNLRPIYIEKNIHDEIAAVAKKLGFKKLTEFIRVWWTSPTEFGKLIETAKKESKERERS